MSLFICSTHCESCEEAASCPMKSEVKSQMGQKLEESIPNPIKEALLEEIEKLTPKKFLEDSTVSIFNLINSVQLLLEKGSIITVSEVARKLEEMISKKHPQIKDDNLVFQDKIQSFLLTIAQRIHESASGNCTRNCSFCYIAEACQRLQKTA